MKLMLLMAFRSLFRQKSRSILIGLGICASAVFIIMGHSFNKGMFKTIVEIYVDSNFTGHCKVNITEKNDSTNRAIIRDRDKIVTILKEGCPNVREVKESLIVPAQAAIHGKGGSFGLTGIQATSPADIRNMEIVHGDFETFFDESIEYPLILEYRQADALKVKTGDIIRIKLNTVYGQVQTAGLNLVATVKLTNPMLSNFMQGALPFERLKALAGYRPHEAQSLNVVMNDLRASKEMISFADEISGLLKPEPAFIEGEFTSKGASLNGTLVGIKSDRASMESYYKQIDVLYGEVDLLGGNTGSIHISKSLADALKLEPGSSVTLSYRPKFDKKKISLDFEVAGIVDDPGIGISSFAFVDDETFFKTYFNDLPANDADGSIVADNKLINCRTYSWKAAERTYSANAYNKKQRNIRRESYNGSILDVVSMQEPMETLFDSESIQGTAIIVIMLFVLSIILVGIVNTTRMNIRERTREIGTLRAIGMQRNAIVRSLVTETEILCVLAILSGVVSSWGLSVLFSRIPIHTNDSQLAFILKDGHLVFEWPIGIIVANLLFIIFMIFPAVFFPAKKAAGEPVADAIGHHE